MTILNPATITNNPIPAAVNIIIDTTIGVNYLKVNFSRNKNSSCYNDKNNAI